MDRFTYEDGPPPADYRCRCGAQGCKLWRPAQNATPLLCVVCALKDEKKSGPVDAEGFRQEDRQPTDTIGWMLPAVPTEDGGGFWGYSSVPQPGVDWWRRLPTTPEGASHG